jgi:hypothetical protein
VSHHPDERVLTEDVAVGLRVVVRFLDLLAAEMAPARELPKPVLNVGAA